MFFKTPDLASGVLSFWALTLLCAALYLPGLAHLPPTDRDEARFMQATKQMIETGDAAHIKFQDEARDKKPVGSYWAQAGFVKLFSRGDLTRVWPYRLPSAVGVWLAVIVTAWSARLIMGPTAGFAAGVVLATTLLATVEAHLAKADGLLLGVSAVVFAGVARAYTLPKGRYVEPGLVFAFWFALGASVLIKGPILPGLLAVALMALLAVDKSLVWMAQLKPWSGLGIAALVVAVWPAVAGWDETLRVVQAAFSQDLLPKLAGGHESHGAPPGTHALAAFLTLWPWSFALPVAGMAAWRNRQAPLMRVCLVWIVPFWLALELTPTKLPHYPLPLFPAVAMVIAASLGPRFTPPRLIAVGVAGVALMIGLAVASITILQTGLPRFRDLNLSERLAEAVRAQATDTAPIILVGYHEPSAVFLLGTKTILTNADHAASLLAATPHAMAAVIEPEVPAMEKILAGLGRNVIRHGAVSGYNYSRGAPATLVLLTVEPTPGP